MSEEGELNSFYQSRVNQELSKELPRVIKGKRKELKKLKAERISVQAERISLQASNLTKRFIASRAVYRPSKPTSQATYKLPSPKKAEYENKIFNKTFKEEKRSLFFK